MGKRTEGTPGHSSAAHARTEWQRVRRQGRLALLGGLACLSDVPQGELASLNELCTLRLFQNGSHVVGRQPSGDMLFLILRGRLQLHVRDATGHEVDLGTLGPGDCCGEGPLFGERFPRMRIIAESDCSLLQIAVADLRNAQRSLPMLMAALRRTYRWRVIDSALARVPLFSRLAPAERTMLATRLRPLHYERDERIVKQGGRVDTLYLVGSGQVRVAHGELGLLLLGEGDFFGEIALLSDRPYPVEVRSTTPTDLLALPRTEFERLLDQHPNLATQLQALLEQRRQIVTAIGTDHEHAGVLEPAVRAGMLRGTHLLVRNSEHCKPDCRRCEQGCADRHGRARLQLDGQMIHGLEVADSCRQCTLDAECAAVCPADAFERTGNGALLVTDRCIGCGKCIPACPYDAVTSVGLPSVRPAPGQLFTLLRTTFERMRRHQIIPLDPIAPHQRADKCDLCHGFADLACVSHCPSGALQLVAVEELFPR